MDKFGNPIYSRVYEIRKAIGLRLEDIGYWESKNKPNTFMRKITLQSQ